MPTMRAFQLSDPSLGTPALASAEVPIPTPGPGEVLIRVHAAGVTPTELLWYPTTHRPDGSPRTGAIPGHEFSGTVAALGPDASATLTIGAEVFGMNDWFAEGATAEFCLAQPTSIAAKPPRLSHAEAAIVPIGALTAWQGLLGRAHLQSGEQVLIHGGAGAVGVFAVQLAKRLAAHITTTASARHADFLRELGADLVLDYRTSERDSAPADYDVIFDAVGGETLQRSWRLLKPGGRLVTIAADAENQTDPRVKESFFIVEPRGDQLADLATLLERGELRAFLDAAVPFHAAGSAYLGTAPRPRKIGKLAISVVD